MCLPLSYNYTVLGVFLYKNTIHAKNRMDGELIVAYWIDVVRFSLGVFYQVP